LTNEQSSGFRVQVSGRKKFRDFFLMVEIRFDGFLPCGIPHTRMLP